jgi:hypothetical protein
MLHQLPVLLDEVHEQRLSALSRAPERAGQARERWGAVRDGSAKSRAPPNTEDLASAAGRCMLDAMRRTAMQNAATHRSPGRDLRWATALLAAGALLAAPARASAAEPAPAPAPAPAAAPAPRAEVSPRQARNFVGVGPLFGITGHTDTPIAGILGVELSYVHYPTQAFIFGVGGFAQAQTVGFSHGRWALGPQINFMMFGAEIGAYVEEGVGPRATTLGLHASPFVSLGFFSAALRIAVPVGTMSEGDPYALDLGLVCAIKFPLALDGELFHMSFH